MQVPLSLFISPPPSGEELQAAAIHAQRADEQRRREQFANNFMLGYMIRNGCTIGQEGHVAKRAFVMADAMLAASKEKS